MICLDIWGGECSQDHLARYMLPIDKALELARSELAGWVSRKPSHSTSLGTR